MNWLFTRAALVGLAAVLGAMVGGLMGWGSELVLILIALGGAAGAALAAMTDRMRGYKLMKWVQGDHVDSAPRDRGFWGELGYRIEKALRQGDKALREERALHLEFLSAIEASPNGVLLLDANEQIEWCNAVAADHFGLHPQRDISQRVTNLVRDPAFVAYLQEGASEPTLTMPGVRGRGTLQVLVRPYGNGKRLVLSSDVTEQERSDAMRRDFVANVSHEIRTPLTVLAGFVESLGSLTLTAVEQRRVLSLMEQQTARMQALVADLLILAQLEGSPRPAPDTWTPVRKLIEQALADALALSGGRHEFDFDSVARGELAGKAGELQSALGNLVSNAVRYTPQGGRIALRWIRRADGSAVIEVQDNGPGIAREHLPRLTERFYRVDGSRSRETGGTGLGLSIVKHVMQRHGGEVDVESQPGKGSCFRLVFPPARVRDEAPGLPDAAASTSGAAPVDRDELRAVGRPPH
jgi:two-component system phosphate regulon sensor histidine kinase PhoR